MQGHVITKVGAIAGQVQFDDRGADHAAIPGRRFAVGHIQSAMTRSVSHRNEGDSPLCALQLERVIQCEQKRLSWKILVVVQDGQLLINRLIDAPNLVIADLAK